MLGPLVSLSVEEDAGDVEGALMCAKRIYVLLKEVGDEIPSTKWTCLRVGYGYGWNDLF
jgi:hypothetical protein